ncbi:hypothetical protein ES703_59228 [subsurface metagenome]
MPVFASVGTVIFRLALTGVPMTGVTLPLAGVKLALALPLTALSPLKVRLTMELKLPDGSTPSLNVPVPPCGTDICPGLAESMKVSAADGFIWKVASALVLLLILVAVIV